VDATRHRRGGHVSDEMLPLASPTDGLVTRPLDDVVDSDAFIPRLLALLSNALV